MPLVPCPDCGRQVSTSAATCPECGRPMPPGPTPTVVASGATAAEQVIWEGVPSMKTMIVELAAAAVIIVALPVAALLLFDPLLGLASSFGRSAARLVAEQRPTIQLVVTVAVAIAVVLRLAKLGAHAAVLRSHRYRVTSQRIVVESGVFSKQLNEVDMRTVEDIQLRQRLLQRLLGIGEIAITCADRQMGRFRLLGVENPREVREQIRSAAYQATQRQLFTRGT